MVKDEIRRLRDRVSAIGVAMLVTDDADGMRSRPVAIFPDPDGEGFYCFSDDRSAKDEQVAIDPDLCLAIADARGGVYVSLTCRGELSQDRAEIAARWTEDAQAWFPGGPEDPHVELLRLKPIRGEIWEGRQSREAIKAELEAARREGRRPRFAGSTKLDFASAA